MALYATINGVIELKADAKAGMVMQRVRNLGIDPSPELIKTESGTQKVLFGGYGKYKDAAMYALIDTAAPNTVSGKIEIFGETKHGWTIYYDAECGKWREMYLPTLMATKVTSQNSYLDAYREYTVCVTTIMEGASI